MKRPGRAERDGPGGRLYEAPGALHVHTLYSDGTGTVEEIARYAGQRGLQWLIITDHEHFIAREKGEEGRHGSVWVLIGSELGEEELPNHYLAFDLQAIPPQDDPVAIVRAVHEQGGFGAIAHPHEKRDVFPDMPPYPWTAWDAEVDGIEIWNQLSQWVEGLTRGNRLNRFLHPLKSLTRPDPETLAVWDRLNLQRPVVGYVGVDAHALKYPLFGGLLHVKVFHYKVQFRSLRTHLLLDRPLERKEFGPAREQILTALRRGRHFGVNLRVGRATGFRFYALAGGERVLPADRIDPGGTVEFVAHSPLDADLVLLRNGREIVKVRGRYLHHRTRDDGVWRLEAHRKGRGWVFTNPIRILPH